MEPIADHRQHLEPVALRDRSPAELKMARREEPERFEAQIRELLVFVRRESVEALPALEHEFVEFRTQNEKIHEIIEKLSRVELRLDRRGTIARMDLRSEVQE
jgi:hypothetical protein